MLNFYAKIIKKVIYNEDVLKTNPALEHNHKAAFGTHFFFPLMHLNIPFKYSVLVCCAIGKILRILKISQ